MVWKMFYDIPKPPEELKNIYMDKIINFLDRKDSL